ncbi:MAG: NAD-dependent epimerase/dehydratase family protein, partial [Elusimicrobia bacterium]|nr:NAD-dependent epimerase/dehydratase family protein [Elusimicrobiota bacterium]
MRALVTGAAGFIGSNLALELRRLGHEVVALDDFSHGAFENLRGFDGDVVTADLRRPEDWRERVGRVDAVFHQAAITDTTVTNQALMMSVNVEAFRSLLQWSAKAGVRRLVYASSAGVYGDLPVPQRETNAPRPLNVYAFSKMVMEAAARDFARRHKRMSVVGLRYFNVFGPGESHKDKAASMIWQLCLQMRAGRRPRIFEFGEQFRDFIYVADVVRANIAAARKGAAGVYNVCTGKKTTFNQIIAELNAALQTDLQPEYFKNPYSFYQNETLGDPGAERRRLGFSAGYDVAAAVREYLGCARRAKAG